MMKQKIVESTQAVRQGRQILQGNCFEAARTLPYAPFLDPLRTYLAARQPRRSPLNWA